MLVELRVWLIQAVTRTQRVRVAVSSPWFCISSAELGSPPALLPDPSWQRMIAAWNEYIGGSVVGMGIVEAQDFQCLLCPHGLRQTAQERVIGGQFE